MPQAADRDPCSPSNRMPTDPTVPDGTLQRHRQLEQGGCQNQASDHSGLPAVQRIGVRPRRTSLRRLGDYHQAAGLGRGVIVRGERH
jgi:hypothetical protein